MKRSLADQLLADIRKQGPLPFDRFMETALYHPLEGFYASGKNRTGISGDFLTPVSTGPVLGELLARQAEELHVTLGRPPLLNLVEQGADTGGLARDLLAAVQNHYPRLAPSVRMYLVEPHACWEKKQRQTLGESGMDKMVRWVSSWAGFPPASAPCFFYSSELVDSFPVKILQFRNGSWEEKRVGAEDSRFVWRNQPTDAETLGQIRRWHPPEVEGFTMELRPGLRPWVQSWAEKITRGMVLTLDYGFPSPELFSPSRSQGSLCAIRSHQRIQDPLTDPGQTDLTAHVNFTELEELGACAGWQSYGLIEFARGLTSLAAPLLEQEPPPAEKWIRNFRHLTHPSFFGQTHKILAQGKGLPDSFKPSILPSAFF